MAEKYKPAVEQSPNNSIACTSRPTANTINTNLIPVQLPINGEQYKLLVSTATVKHLSASHETSQMTEKHSVGGEQEVSDISHQEEDFQSKHLFSDEDRNEQPTPAGQHLGSRSACNVKVNQPGHRNEHLDDMPNHNNLLYGGIVDRGPPPDACASGSDNPWNVPASPAVDSDPPDLQRLVIAQERGGTEDRGTPPHVCTSGSGNPHDVAAFPGVDTDPPENPPESVAVQERGFRPMNDAVSPAVDTDPPAYIPESAAVQEEGDYIDLGLYPFISPYLIQHVSLLDLGVEVRRF